MIYLTGDTHGEFDRFVPERLVEQNIYLREQDYILVCGDFGLCWRYNKDFECNCNFFAQMPYTILWIQGNHENYDMIGKYPIEEWHGGKVRHIVRDKVILLERGQVFEMEDKTFFTFGGAASHDIEGGILDRRDPQFLAKRKRADEWGLPYRIIHESWWSQELPSEEEMQEGLRNLEICNYRVDYVITHCCSSSMQEYLNLCLGHLYKPDALTDYFMFIEEKLDYGKWYFGHYHADLRVDEKHQLLFQKIVAG